MSGIVEKTFNALLAGGRTCAFMGVGVRILRDSALSLAEGALEYLVAIGGDQFAETMREDAVENCERQFGIEPTPGQSLRDRADEVDRAWALSGAQGPGYIQKVLNDAGFPVVVTENLPVADLLSSETWSMGEEPDPGGSISMGEESGSPGIGEGFEGYLLGNGRLLQNDGTYLDPIETPTAAGAGESPSMTDLDTSMTELDSSMGEGINLWAYVFIIEGEGGDFATIPSESRQKFEDLVLRLKPAHLGVLMKINYL